MADRRLSQPNSAGRARSVPFCNEGVEDDQQIEIDVGNMNLLHHGDTNNELDLSQASQQCSARMKAGADSRVGEYECQVPIPSQREKQALADASSRLPSLQQARSPSVGVRKL